MVTPEGAQPRQGHTLAPSLTLQSLYTRGKRTRGALGTHPLAFSPPPFPTAAQSSRTMGSLVLAGCEGAGRGTGGRTAISGGFTFRGKLGLRAARRISRWVRAFRRALARKRGESRRLILEVKLHIPHCNSPGPFFSGIPALHPVFWELVLSDTLFPTPAKLHCQPLGPSHGGLRTWYLLWPQTPQDWGHQLGLVSDAWRRAVSLSESLRPGAFHWQKRGLLPSGKGRATQREGTLSGS